jgi:SAM-dependent methyltransferase
MIFSSPLTGSSNTKVIYTQHSIPLFQNKIYTTFELSLNIEKVDVNLVQCLDTGFIFSGGFDINKLNYDENYQNEQANSNYFKLHLDSVVKLLNSRNLLQGKILEIGCGKGYFLDLLLKQGIDVIGIDPTFEGDSPKVIKDYYNEKYSYLNADLIVLRHTLEHIPDPLGFIKMISQSNNYKGKIYIEIPTFDWIAKHNAIEDIFYEHCNYFTPKTISQLFYDCEIIYLFGGQYIGVIADLSKVRDNIKVVDSIERYTLYFENKLKEYENKIDKLTNVAIWGAGAKGSTLLNLIDSNMDKIKCVIDINNKKQNKYIGGTGHPVIAPDKISIFEIENIIVMNENYLDEIKDITPKGINILTL